MFKSNKNTLNILQDKIIKLSHELVGMLQEKKYTITTAESCTGGMLSSYITSVVGSSNCFNGSFVTYSNEMKIKIIGVKKDTLEKYGAVSSECVKEMSLGAMKIADSDIAISVSGIAGPDGGTKEKPVGTVWICVSNKTNTIPKCFLFEGSREEVRLQATLNAFEIALSILK